MFFYFQKSILILKSWPYSFRLTVLVVQLLSCSCISERRRPPYCSSRWLLSYFHVNARSKNGADTILFLLHFCRVCLWLATIIRTWLCLAKMQVQNQIRICTTLISINKLSFANINTQLFIIIKHSTMRTNKENNVNLCWRAFWANESGYNYIMYVFCN